MLYRPLFRPDVAGYMRVPFPTSPRGFGKPGLGQLIQPSIWAAVTSYAQLAWLAATGAAPGLTGVEIIGYSDLGHTVADTYFVPGAISTAEAVTLNWTGIEYVAITGGNGRLYVNDIEVNDPLATPLPAALPLFATGLGALALLGWRKKRTARSVAV